MAGLHTSKNERGAAGMSKELVDGLASEQGTSVEQIVSWGCKRKGSPHSNGAVTRIGADASSQRLG